MDIVRRRRGLVLGLAVLVVVGVMSALVDQPRLALAVIVVLVGIGVLATIDGRDAATRAARAEVRAKKIEAITRVTARRTRRMARVVVPMEKMLPGLARQDTLEAAERRVFASFEAERLRAADRHRELIKAMPASPVSALTKAMKDEVREVEALLQLLPRITPRSLMPPSGRWAMSARGLVHLADLVAQHEPRVVLELGSGTSSVYLGYLLEGTGARVVSVDHSAEFAELTREAVARHALGGVVEVRHAALVETVDGDPESSWYDRSVFSDVDGVDLLIVDGPPGSVHPMVRGLTLPALLPQLAPGALVVLDDAERPDERAIVEGWVADHGLVELDKGVSRLAVLRVPDAPG